MPIVPIRERLLSRAIINPVTGCWEWQGTKTHGYGRISVGRQMPYAHRVAWELWFGPVPEDMTLDHVCHDPEECQAGDDCPHRACVNPAHLEPVPWLENMMRGGSWSAANARKTHCPAGHEYTPENTYVIPSTGSRSCIACEKDRGHVRDGTGPGSANKRKTQCSAGHPYDEANTHITKDGWRRCRACNRENVRRIKQQRRAA